MIVQNMLQRTEEEKNLKLPRRALRVEKGEFDFLGKGRAWKKKEANWVQCVLPSDKGGTA